MRPTRLILFAALPLCLAFISPLERGRGDDDPTAPEAPRVVGYLASWGVRSKGTAIANLPAKQLTHIFYAFALIGPDGSVVLGDRCVDVGACDRGAALPAQLGGNFV